MIQVNENNNDNTEKSAEKPTEKVATEGKHEADLAKAQVENLKNKIIK